MHDNCINITKSKYVPRCTITVQQGTYLDIVMFIQMSTIKSQALLQETHNNFSTNERSLNCNSSRTRHGHQVLDASKGYEKKKLRGAKIFWGN